MTDSRSKIPLISLTCPELEGGWGRGRVNLANALANMGFRVHMLLEKDTGQFIRLLKPEIKILRLPTTHTISGIPYFAAYLLRHRPHGIFTPVARHTVLALHAKGLTGLSTKIVPSIHNTYGETLKQVSTKKRLSRVKKLRKYYPLCDGIITVSQGAKKDFCTLTGIAPESVTTIYNPIYTEELIQRSRVPIDHPWFQAEEPPVVLSVGRLELQKNFPLLIDSFNLLRSRTSCRLVIIGEGSERGVLESRISSSDYSDDISLIGFEINPFPFMKRAGVFVLSSSWEGFGNVLIEAMATGTPVVSTDCPNGPREILGNGTYGSLVPVDDPGKLAEAIFQALKDPLDEDILLQRASSFSDRVCAKAYAGMIGLTGNI